MSTALVYNCRQHNATMTGSKSKKEKRLSEIHGKEKPSVEFTPERIPEELKGLSNWVLWKPEPRDGKWTKPPYCVENPGRKASSTDPSTWSDFETAVQVAQEQQCGIGSALTEDFGIVGVDFDNSLDDEDFLRWIKKFNSYAEISPSGNGYRIFVKGTIPKALKRGSVECYSKGRYLTVTGNRIEGSPDSVRCLNGELEEFYAEFAPPGVESTGPPRNSSEPVPSSIKDVLSLIRGSKQENKFFSLFEGSSEGYPSKSEADAAMFAILAFWCQRDPQLVRDVALSSKRNRPKWLSGRGKQDWLAQQIETVCDTFPTTYDSIDSNDIECLNQEYALVQVSNKMVVLREYFCPVEGSLKVDYLAPTDFNYKVGVKLGKKWLASDKKRQYDRVIFCPKSGLDPNFYNLWRGFAVKPERNDNLTARYWEHIRENVCQGNNELFVYFKSWMAKVVQEPWEAGQTSLVLRGDQGVGKSIVVNLFGKLFGSHYVCISDPYRLVGKFNSLLHNKVLVFGDEAFWAGDKTAEGTIKRMVGCETLTIELKGKDAQELRSYLHLMIASNAKWVVPAGLSERRFAVFEVGDKRKQEADYFGPMAKDFENGGASALLWDLLDFQIEIDTNKIPNTEALDEQKVQSASLYESLIMLIEERGYLHEDIQEDPFKEEGQETQEDLWTGELIFPLFWEELVQSSKDAGRRLGLTKKRVGMDLRKAFGKPQRKRIHLKDGEKMCAVYDVPTISDIRLALSA